MALNDPLVPFQWYLDQTNSVGAAAGFKDLGGLQSVWADYIGRGIRIGIFDSGVDISHPDLAGNYLASLNPTFNGGPLDPSPTTGGQGAPDAHGTSVAGIIAGVANNNVGIAGIAYGAKFGVGLAIGNRNNVSVDSALIEQMRLQTNFDIVNHSWGYTAPFSSNQDSGLTQDQEFMQAISAAAQNGRNGLGTIMVVSAGNGREDDINNGNGLRGPNSSNDQSFENSRFVITVAAADRNGNISSYSDPGAANIITGFGGPGEGGAGNSNVFTADISGAAGYNNGSQQIASQTIDASFSGFNGTSAAAPTVTGVIALMLEARPTLGWRDVKEILALSAVHTGSAIGAAPAGPELYSWRFNGADYWNGGGLHTSEDYGFGLVNARNAVRLAETWSAGQRSTNEAKTTAAATNLAITVPDNNPLGSVVNLAVSGNIRVETVELKLTFNVQRSRDLRVDLISPSGTTVTLIKDLGDAVSANVNQPVASNGTFTFSATGFLGEKASGNWQARIIDTQTGQQISVSAITLHVYGEDITANDTYYYNDEFQSARSLAGGGARGVLADTNGGVDTLNAAQLSAAAVINLNEGANSTLAGSTLSIGQGTAIENAVAGDGHDSITGNGLDNLLQGMRGNDTLSGEAGNDTLEGGFGNDDLSGGEGNDVLNGGDGVDSLNGGLGDDVLEGGKGANVLDGAQGNDTLLGGNEADFLYGGAGNDSIRGFEGDDLVRPDGGNDVVVGGLGKDIVRYSGVRADVTVSRAPDGSYTVTGVAAGSDQLSEVERISFEGGGAYVLDANSIVMPLAQVLKNTVYQPMESATLVYRLYAAAYARTPDEGGFVFWANRVLAGDVAADVLAQQFRLAPEFTQKYGANLDDRTYTDKLYSNVLGRPSDQAGLDFWTGHLTQNYYNRDQLMAVFAVSPENVTRTLPDVSNGYWVL